MKPLSRKLMILFILLGMMGISWPVSAQDLPELPNTYTSADGTFSFHYPDGWTVFTEDWEIGGTSLWNGTVDEHPLTNPTEESVLVGVLSPDYVQNELLDYNTIHLDAELFLKNFFRYGAGDTAYSIVVEETQSGGRTATSILFRDDDKDGQVILVELEDGAIGIVFGISYQDNFEPHQATVEAMAASMQVHEYEAGGVRPIMVNALDVRIDIPTEYYAVPEQGAMVFGTEQAILNDEMPEAGGVYAAIFSAELLGIDTEAIETLEALFDTVLNIFYGGEDDEFIPSPIETTIFDDSIMNERLQATYTLGDYEGVVVLIEFVDGEVVFLNFGVNSGELVDFEDTISAIVESIQRTDMDEAGIGSG